MKNQFLGILFIIAAFALIIWQSKDLAPNPNEGRPTFTIDSEKQQFEDDFISPVTQSDEATAQDTTSSSADFIEEVKKAAPLITSQIEAAEPTKQSVPEETYTIENDYIRVTFSNHGGAIKQLELIHADDNGRYFYPETLEGSTPYIFNKHSPMPALGISWSSSQDQLRLKEFAPVYELVAHKKHLIQFRLKTEQGIEIIRGYKIADNADESDPYVVKHQTGFTNETETAFNLKNLYVNTGTLPPTQGDIYSQYLNFAYYDTIKSDVDYVKITEFVGTQGFMGIGARAAADYVQIPESKHKPVSISWAAVKNQFFTGLITAKEPGIGLYVAAFDLGDTAGLEEKDRMAITGNIAFDLGEIKPNEKVKLHLDYYVGPKEFARLQALGGNQDKLMQFGWGPFAVMAKILLIALKAIHSVVVNISPEWAWGFTIILLTIFVKGLLWPLTAMQVRSSKKMQTIQAPLQEIREKYKENPQKQQQETLKLFKENQVNPAAGCLPLLIQIPIFIGLFFMLRTASELRFASFLWINDLSVSDTIAWLPELPSAIPMFGGPIHILPIIMGVTMYFQMQMMPTPTTDNVQVKMMKFMPLIFFVFSYRFPAGLVLYWTVQNLLTILQTKMTRDKNDTTLAVVSTDTTKGQSVLKSRGNKHNRNKSLKKK